jgi:hypothetical protein
MLWLSYTDILSFSDSAVWASSSFNNRLPFFGQLPCLEKGVEKTRMSFARFSYRDIETRQNMNFYHFDIYFSKLDTIVMFFML